MLTRSMPTARSRRPIPKRVFQSIAIATLPLPAYVTYRCAPGVLGAAGDPSGPLKVLVVVLVLLVAVVAWALALLPVRRMSTMPTLQEEMALRGATSFGELFDHARVEHAQLRDAGADRPDRRRRYHTRMAIGSLVVTLATGIGTYAMLTDGGDTLFLAFPVVAISSAVLALYHAVRALTAR
jgi:hypothetical protein